MSVHLVAKQDNKLTVNCDVYVILDSEGKAYIDTHSLQNDIRNSRVFKEFLLSQNKVEEEESNGLR